MKIFFVCLRIVLFCSFGVFLFIHISYMYRPELAHTRSIVTGFYSEPDNSLDVVIFGTSGTFSSFAPMIAWTEQGFTSYNFCTNAMATETIKFAIIEALKTQHPKLFVVDIFPFIIGHSLSKFKNDSFIRYNTDSFKFSLNRLNLIIKNIPLDSNFIYYFFDIGKYHTLNSNYIFKSWEQHSYSKGYQPLPWDGPVRRIDMDTDESIPLDENIDDIFTDLLTFCKTLDINVLFVCYPFGDLFDIYKDTEYNQEHVTKRINYIKSRINKFGFEFFNMMKLYDQIGLDFNKDYWDAQHFNIFGAEKVTRFFAEYLKLNYKLPGHHNDNIYVFWSGDYLAWTANVDIWEAEIKNKYLTGINVLEFNVTYPFTKYLGITKLLLNSWNAPEITGVWTSSREAELVLPLRSRPNLDPTVAIDFSFLGVPNANRGLRIKSGNIILFDYLYSDSDMSNHVTVRVPLTHIGDDNTIRLVLETKPRIHEELDPTSHDSRSLGVFVNSIRVENY